MITSGMGSLAISGGTVDVLGYVDGEYPNVLPRKDARVYFVE